MKEKKERRITKPFRRIVNRVEEHKRRKKEKEIERSRIRKEQILEKLQEMIDAKREELGLPEDDSERKSAIIRIKDGKVTWIYPEGYKEEEEEEDD